MEIYTYMAILLALNGLIAVEGIVLYFVTKRLEQLVPKIINRPRKVVIANVAQIQEDGMSQYKYTFTLPALGAKDVVKREMHVSINDVVSMYEIDPMLTEYTLTFAEDANVSIHMIDIDDAGNRSLEGETMSFVVIDTVPPEAPGVVVIKDVEEIIEEEPVVEEPVIEEPVMEEPVMEEPVVEEPVVEEPVVEEPVMEEPVMEEPVVEEPVVEEPVVEEPVVEEPVMEEPVVEEPVMEEPVVEEETTE